MIHNQKVGCRRPGELLPSVLGRRRLAEKLARTGHIGMNQPVLVFPRRVRSRCPASCGTFPAGAGDGRQVGVAAARFDPLWSIEAFVAGAEGRCVETNSPSLKSHGLGYTSPADPPGIVDGVSNLRKSGPHLPPLMPKRPRIAVSRFFSSRRCLGEVFLHGFPVPRCPPRAGKPLAAPLPVQLPGLVRTLAPFGRDPAGAGGHRQVWWLPCW